MSCGCLNEFQLTIKSQSPNFYFELTDCKGQSNQSWLKRKKTSTTTQISVCEWGKSNQRPSNYCVYWPNLQKLNRLTESEKTLRQIFTQKPWNVTRRGRLRWCPDGTQLSSINPCTSLWTGLWTHCCPKALAKHHDCTQTRKWRKAFFLSRCNFFCWSFAEPRVTYHLKVGTLQN